MLHLSCCEFPLTPCFIHPSDFLHPPCTLCTNPLFYSPLSAPRYALPSLPSPSLGPPARSFPRTACSQHPLPDWLMGIKGPVPPAEHMARLQLCYHSAIIPIPPEAAYCTATHAYTHVAAHMYKRQWIQRYTRGWQNIWHTHIHRLSLKSGCGCLLYATWHVTYQSDKGCSPANTPTHTRYEKNTWPMLADSQLHLNQANVFSLR